MGTIYDLAQQRAMIRCKTSANIVLTPTLVNLGVLSALDSVTTYFASTNHLMNHTAEMIVRVKAADPLTAFPVGDVSFIAGFVFPAKQCQVINEGTDSYYAINGVFRSGANNFNYRLRRHGVNDTSGQLTGINDADWTDPGIEIRMQVTNRHVVWAFRKTGNLVWISTPNFPKAANGPYPSGDLDNLTPPAGGRFRWNGSDPRSGGTNLPVREILIPMFHIKSACTLDILAVNAGEAPQVPVPVQP